MADIGIASIPRFGFARTASPYVPALVIALAAVLHLNAGTNADVSWLLTLDDKMLAGARPYVDFLETNPPASILLYLPAAWLGRIIGIAPELIVALSVFGLALASLALCARIVVAAGLVDRHGLPLFGACAAAMLLVLPCHTYAERDHIALIAILPALCLYAGRLRHWRPGLAAALCAGLGGGLAVIIKPYFALALAVPFALLLWRQRAAGWRLAGLAFALENMLTAALALAYGAFVFWQYPAYTTSMLPLVTTLYVPAKLPLFQLLANPSILNFLVGIGIALLLAGRKVLQPVHAVPLLAATGFMLVTLWQGKGWPYQGYPGVALVLLVIGNLLILGENAAARHVSTPIVALLFALMFGSTLFWFNSTTEQVGLRDAIAARTKPHPSLLTVSADIGLGHPLTRLLNGSWAGSVCSLWMSNNAHYLLQGGDLSQAQADAIQHYAALDRQLLAHDLTVNKPDVVLFGPEGWHDWAFSDPAIRDALGVYRQDATVDGVEIWLRKPTA